MNLFIEQNIVIHTIKIDGISNSSVFQIGSAGVIKSLSQFYNSGQFTQPAPSLGQQMLKPTQIYVPLIEPPQVFER
ncbi:spore germination protein GerPB [Paenibacillus sp. SI8]|uniref:spore germination protein GerPB n=1 Tax=unclassified Paenibacillus TaxID=185978 RepID=UPI003466BC0A